MMRVPLLSALLFCSALSPSGAAAPLGMLEIRGIDNLAGAVFDLSKAIGQPVPKEIVSLGIYGVLGTMPGMGIEPNGTLRALWLDDGSAQGAVALLLPVEGDGSAYLDSLAQSSWKRVGDDDAPLRYEATSASFVPWRAVSFVRSGSTLVASDCPEKARLAADALAQLPPILPAEGSLAVQIGPAALVDAFGPQIQEAMDKAFRSVPGQSDPAAAMGALYAKAYLAAARQIDETVLGLGVADGNLNLHSRLGPAAESLLAQWLGTLRAPSANAAIVNLPGALFVETAHLGDLGLLADSYFQFIEELLKSVPADFVDASMDAYLENAKTYWSQLGGDFGIALLPPADGHPLRLAEYFELKDAAAMRALVAPMVDAARAMVEAAMAADADAPVAIELALAESREYRGVPVDRVSYRVAIGDALQAIWPGRPSLDLSVEMAWLPGGVAVGVGGEDVVDMMVDRALGAAAVPVAALAPWKAFFPDDESRPVDFSHAALFDLLRTYLGLLDGLTGEDSADAIPDGPGHLSSISYVDMDGLMTRLRFSLADVAALVRKGQEAQQRAMQARREQMRAFEEMMEAGEIDFDMPDDDEFEAWDADE